jgi:glyoxylase-like metal-dependent hydrolase (beta-lactamase superfamily II)
VLARDGTRTILIDTGYGGKFSLLDRKFYDMEPGEPLVESLHQLGVVPEQVDMVVFSHLHFDHVCGATRCDGERRLVLTFPHAVHVVGRREWEDATGGALELQTAYPRNDIAPLRGARLRLVEDAEEIVPGLAARLTGGHTRGHLALVFHSDGQTAIYPGDLCPSRAHVRRMWHPAYDVCPLDTRRCKPELLGEAADGNWWILWNHDAGVAVSRLRRDSKREFVPLDARQRL